MPGTLKEWQSKGGPTWLEQNGDGVVLADVSGPGARQ